MIKNFLTDHLPISLGERKPRAEEIKPNEVDRIAVFETGEWGIPKKLGGERLSALEAKSEQKRELTYQGTSCSSTSGAEAKLHNLPRLLQGQTHEESAAPRSQAEKRIPKVGDEIKLDTWRRFYTVSAVDQTHVCLTAGDGRLSQWKAHRADWIFEDEQIKAAKRIPKVGDRVKTLPEVPSYSTVLEVNGRHLILTAAAPKSGQEHLLKWGVSIDAADWIFEDEQT